MMKRLLSVLLAACIPFSLAACETSAHTLSAVYSGDIQATDGRVNYMAQLDTDGESLCVALSSPESVAGVSYTFRGGELHIGLNGLDCITSPESLPEGSVPLLLYRVFTQADEAEFQGAEDGVETYTLAIGKAEATVTAKGGVPLTITAGSTEVFLRR